MTAGLCLLGSPSVYFLFGSGEGKKKNTYFLFFVCLFVFLFSRKPREFSLLTLLLFVCLFLKER